MAQVLLVEPETDSEPQLIGLLRGWGGAAHVARNSDLAARLALQRYDLVLLRVKPGAQDALEQLQRIRDSALNATVPVIAMLPESFTEESRLLLTNGVNDILTMPTTVRAIARVCWYWLPENSRTKPNESSFLEKGDSQA